MCFPLLPARCVLDVIEQYGPTKTGRIKGLRAVVRVQTRDSPPSRDELLPDLVAEVRLKLSIEHSYDLYKTLAWSVLLCHCALCDLYQMRCLPRARSVQPFSKTREHNLCVYRGLISCNLGQEHTKSIIYSLSCVYTSISVFPNGLAQ